MDVCSVSVISSDIYMMNVIQTYTWKLVINLITADSWLNIDILLQLVVQLLSVSYIITNPVHNTHFTLFFQWPISGETLTAGPVCALLPGFVVYASSVYVSFPQFYHSLDMSGCDAPDYQFSCKQSFR